MSNENLDKLFKNKLGDRELPFDEAAWGDALRLIEEQEKKKKRKWFIVWVIIGLGLISSAVAYYNTGVSKVQQGNIVSENQQKPDAQANAIKEPNYDSLMREELRRDTNYDIIAETEDNINISDDLTNYQPTAGNKSITNNPAQNGGETTSTSKQQPSSDVGSNDKPKEVVKQDEDGPHIIFEKYPYEVLTARLYPSGFTFEYATEFIEIDATGQVDRIKEANEKQKKDKKDDNFYRHRFGLIGGVSNIASFQNVAADSLYQASNNNVNVFGLAYTYAFNNKWTVSINPVYYKRSDLNSNRTVNSTTYSFGYTNSEITENTNELTLIDVPMILGYRVFKSHYIELGWEANVVINSQHTLTEKSSSSFGQTVTSTEEATGYRTGFKDMSYSISLGYKVQATPNFSLSLQAARGVQDMTEDKIYNNSTFDRNIQYRIMLRYDVFKK